MSRKQLIALTRALLQERNFHCIMIHEMTDILTGVVLSVDGETDLHTFIAGEVWFHQKELKHLEARLDRLQAIANEQFSEHE